MMPPDEQVIPDRRQPSAQQTVNVGGEAVNGGLQGAILKYAQTSIVTLFLILFAYLFQQYVSQSRADRLEDRQTFRDAVKALQEDASRQTKVFNDEQNRRAAEIVATLNYNSARVQDLTNELKNLRDAGVIRREVPLTKPMDHKAAPP